MKYEATIIAAVILLMPVAHSAYAENIPSWIKNNAAWWAEGTISEGEFLNGIQYLIKEDVLLVTQTQATSEKASTVPDWVKNNAAWWAEGVITDDEFLNGIQHLIKIGMISVPSEKVHLEKTQSAEKKQSSTNSETAALESELEACQEIKKAYDRLKCEDKVEAKILALDYKKNAKVYSVGPVNFYFKGADLEIISAERANLSISMLVENTRTSDNVSMFCSGPSVCNYDVVAGDKVYKYSSQDFTNGQIVLKPGESKEFTMLFGPNIGYGGTEFEYDPSKDYSFRISEPWGSAKIPLELG